MRGVSFRRAGAVAGVAYVVLVAIENLDVLDVPGYDSPAADVVAAYGDAEVKVAITTAAGTLALVAFVIAAVALLAVAREDRGGDTGSWSVVGLAGAIAGPSLGAVALALHTTLVVHVDDGFSPDLVTALHDARLAVHAVAGLPIGLFLVGTAAAGLTSGRFPRWLGWPAVVIGVQAVAVAVAGFAAGTGLRAAVTVVLAAAAAWLLVASLWSLLDDLPSRPDGGWATMARLLAGTVAVAAGVSGLALVLFPSSTADYFSWSLLPPPLAALIGGFYLASSVVYGAAVVAPWIELRVVTAGIVALSVPVFVSTLAHLDAFDFGRLQAWAWVVLFGAFPLAAAVSLWGQWSGQRSSGDPPFPPSHGREDRPLGPASRVAAATVAVLLVGSSMVLWVDPASAGDAVLPFTPSPLGGRVLGGWTLLLGVLSGWVAIHGAARGARLAALAAVAFPAGALVGAVRTLGDLESGSRYAYLLVVLAWLAAGVVLALDVARWTPDGRRDGAGEPQPSVSAGQADHRRQPL